MAPCTTGQTPLLPSPPAGSSLGASESSAGAVGGQDWRGLSDRLAGKDTAGVRKDRGRPRPVAKVRAWGGTAPVCGWPRGAGLSRSRPAHYAPGPEKAAPGTQLPFLAPRTPLAPCMAMSRVLASRGCWEVAGPETLSDGPAAHVFSITSQYSSHRQLPAGYVGAVRHSSGSFSLVIARLLGLPRALSPHHSSEAEGGVGAIPT